MVLKALGPAKPKLISKTVTLPHIQKMYDTCTLYVHVYTVGCLFIATSQRVYFIIHWILQMIVEYEIIKF